MKYTGSMFDGIAEQTGAYMNAKVNDMSARDILAQIYVEKLEDKTMEQGYIMADSLLGCIRQFDQAYQQAANHASEYLMEFARRMEEGKNDREKYIFWMETAAAVSASTAQLHGENCDYCDTLVKIEQRGISDEITPELLKQVRETALHALRHCGILFAELPAHADEMETAAKENQMDSLIVRIGLETEKEMYCEYRAIAAMLIYTGIKNQEYASDIPVDITLQQTAVAVCGEFERLRIAGGTGSQEGASAAGESRLNMLSMVTGTLLVAAMVSGAMTVIFGVFGFMKSMPAILNAVMGTLFAMTKGMRTWSEERNMIMSAHVLKTSDIQEGLRGIGRRYMAGAHSVMKQAREYFVRTIQHLLSDKRANEAYLKERARISRKNIDRRPL
ncbi:MAG: hypothetical protein E7321_01540 [Clostridiales bacterium]|nr:hypothetical protein [Clostridiales bacterium]